MINAVGTGWVFLVNAGSTLAVITGLALMRSAELHPAPRVARGKGQLREGLRYVRGRPDLVLTMLLVFVVGTFGLNFQITLALVARYVFGRGAGSYGLLSTALAVGSLAGALLATRRRGRPRLRFLLFTAAMFGLLEAAVGVMPTYLAVAIVLVPAGAAALSFTVAANSSVQLGVEPTMRGRVMALYLLSFMGGTPAGAPTIGALADAFGPRAGLVGGGLICVLVALLIGARYARRRGIPIRAKVVAAVRRRPPVALPRPRLPDAAPPPGAATADAATADAATAEPVPGAVAAGKVSGTATAGPVPNAATADAATAEPVPDAAAAEQADGQPASGGGLSQAGHGRTVVPWPRPGQRRSRLPPSHSSRSPQRFPSR
jgi:hypothetical protein